MEEKEKLDTTEEKEIPQSGLRPRDYLYQKITVSKKTMDIFIIIVMIALIIALAIAIRG